MVREFGFPRIGVGVQAGHGSLSESVGHLVEYRESGKVSGQGGRVVFHPFGYLFVHFGEYAFTGGFTGLRSDSESFDLFHHLFVPLQNVQHVFAVGEVAEGYAEQRLGFAVRVGASVDSVEEYLFPFLRQFLRFEKVHEVGIRLRSFVPVPFRQFRVFPEYLGVHEVEKGFYFAVVADESLLVRPFQYGDLRDFRVG